MESAIVQLAEETNKQYELRRQVYNSAMKGGKPSDRSIVLSMLFRNMHYLGVTYPHSLFEEVKPFVPEEITLSEE